MEYVILRPSAVYGPYDNRLEKLYNSASKGGFPLFGPGAGRRHMVYVGDLAKAFLLACTSPEANGCEMIIAGPKAVPLREMLQILAKCLGRKNCGPRLPLRPMLLAAAVVEDVCGLVGLQPPIYRRRMNFYLNDIEFDCSLARERLNWVAQVSLEEGFRRTLDARSSGHTGA
jgi:nucleoside-diphosphate-sugar epimerase